MRRPASPAGSEPARTREPAHDAGPAGPRLGLRANLAQFSLLVGVNALVGGMAREPRCRGS